MTKQNRCFRRAYGSDDPLEYDDGVIRQSRHKLIEESNMELKFEEDQQTLKFLPASLFATLLEDAITELRFLDECNNELRIIRTESDRHILLLDKYGVHRPAVTDELADIDPKNLKCDKYKLDKLAMDRATANAVLVSTYLDLSLRKTYDGLLDFNKRIRDLDTYCICLVEDEVNNKVSRRELSKQVRQQRIHARSVTYDTDCVIENLKGYLEDASLISEARSRYIDNWQVARTEQNTQVIFDTEIGPTQTIKYYRQRQDHEARVHTEVELLTNIIINETLVKVEQWMDKYDKDMEHIDLKIQLQKNDYQSEKDKREAMEELYARHGEEMKAWVKFTTEREAERQYRLKMNKAAIVVQAWWRGLLVRLELGPYKVPKKKGDKKKKK